MNLKTLNISVTPCFVCKYAFSDKHHIWPQAKGGKSLPTILLCPNHHRFANLVQAMLLRGIQRSEIEAFAQQYFDPAFNTDALGFLITEQERLGVYGWAAYAEQREQAARTDPQGTLAAAGAFERGWRARLSHMRSDEQIPMAEYQEALAHLGATLTALDALESPVGSATSGLPQEPITQDDHRQLLDQIDSLLSLRLATFPMSIESTDRVTLISEIEAFFTDGHDRDYPIYGKVLRQIVDALEVTD